MRRRSCSDRAGSLMSPWNVMGRPTFLGPAECCLPRRRPRFASGSSSSLPVKLSATHQAHGPARGEDVCADPQPRLHIHTQFLMRTAV